MIRSAAVLTLLMILSSLAAAQPAQSEAVRLGVDVLFEEKLELLRGKKVGLITNASGVDGQLVPTADRFARSEAFELVQLYAPEHGLRGALPAGARVEDTVDEATGVPVQSLFLARRRPTPESLKALDVLVFDIQDIGSRTYTYTTTMGEAMIAAKRAGIPLVVLDRPNPLGGERFEGPIRERAFKSFIGFGPTPVSHGLTAGELARFFNAAMDIGCELEVVPMRGWRRAMTWGETGLTFVPTSPGIPHARNALLYVATGMVGGVTRNINEGVGTTMPFETIAAEFIDGPAFAKALREAALPGVRFRPVTYRPYYHRHKGKMLHGVQLIVDDARAFRPLATALTLLTTIERLWPKQMRFRRERSVARVWGTTRVQEMVQAGASAAEIEATFTGDLVLYGVQRAEALLYD